MSQTLKTTFATRRDAELAVERLVQEHGLERSDIFIAPEGVANSSGESVSGSDNPTAAPTEDGRSDAALNGRIEVSVDLQDDALASVVADVFREMDGQDT
ncbi:MAG: hypothetical protein U1A73_24120 [Pseudomonas sp.]|nr:hypothetical protein [Pseudomonas sp.]